MFTPNWLTLPLIAAKSISEGGPVSFRLHQNYPNPSNPGTTIRYELRIPQRVQLKLFNVLGQEVRTLVDKVQDGQQTYYLDASGLSSGVYFVRLFSGSYHQTIKIQVIK